MPTKQPGRWGIRIRIIMGILRCYCKIGSSPQIVIVTCIIYVEWFLFILVNLFRVHCSSPMKQFYLFYLFATIKVRQTVFLIKIFLIYQSVLNSYQLCDGCCCKFFLHFCKLWRVLGDCKCLNILFLLFPIIGVFNQFGISQNKL